MPSADETRVVGADRVLAVLKELALHPNGISLDDLTRAMASAKPTVHRALASLRRAGLAERDTYGHYILGDELLRLAFAHHDARPEQARVRPVLSVLARRFGETAHYAALDGRDVVYRDKVDPPAGAIRLTSTVGGRNPAHATAVGKTLLAPELDTIESVKRWIGRRPLPGKTPNTICTAQQFHRELVLTRERGYGLDREENEIGVNCIALPAFVASHKSPSGAVSVTALAYSVVDPGRRGGGDPRDARHDRPGHR